MPLYTDKIYSIFMYVQTGDNQVCTLEVLDIHEQEIKFGYKIMPNKVRLKNSEDNNIK